MRDIEIVNGGSVVLLVPVTDDGRRWVAENLDGAMWYGQGVVVEPRYLAPIVEGMEDGGLSVA